MLLIPATQKLMRIKASFQRMKEYAGIFDDVLIGEVDGPPRRVRIGIDVPPSFRGQLLVKAAARGLTVSDYVVHLVQKDTVL